MYNYIQHIRLRAQIPLMVMEFWTGWFDHWGEKHHVWPIEGERTRYRPLTKLREGHVFSGACLSPEWGIRVFLVPGPFRGGG